MVRRASTARGAGLGPRGHRLFERLFGAVQREQPLAAPKFEARSLAIASGKGGTGKSFFATSLAVELHRQQKSTALIDCDFGLACDHLLMGVQPKVNLQHVLSGKAELDDIRVPTPSGPTLIPGVTGVRQMTHLTDAGLRTFARCLGELAACEDVLVLDMGAGISNQNVVTLSCADHVVLVIQPELASLTDAYAIVKCVAQLSDRPKLSVVVNRTTTSTQGPATFDKLAQVARKFTGLNLHYVGAIPEDPAVTLRRLGQQPIVATDPGGAIASAVRATVRRLSEVSGPFERREVPAAEGIEARFLAHRQIF